MQNFSRETTVTFPQITYQADGTDVIVGRVDTGVFLAIPTEAKEILDSLAGGMSIGQASDLYQEKYGEIPDIEGLLSVLEEKGIVSPAGAEAVKTAAKEPRARQLNYHFSNFPQPLARLLFGKTAVLAYCLLILAGMVETITYPSLRPRVSDLYFPSDRALTWGLVVVAAYLTLFLHELAHLIAARAHGISSRLGVGHRLWFLVAETDMTGLWSIPSKERYLPFLAGMLSDAVLCAGLVFILAARGHGMLVIPALLLRFLRAFFFTVIMRIVWQFFLYLRTDLYYVIANALKCRNLMGDTEVFFRNQLAKIFSGIRAASQEHIPNAEMRIIRIYLLVWLLGRASAFIILFTVTLPVAVHYTRDLFNVFTAGFSSSPSNFVDSFVLSMCFLVPLSAGAVLWIRDLLRRGRILA